MKVSLGLGSFNSIADSTNVGMGDSPDVHTIQQNDSHDKTLYLIARVVRQESNISVYMKSFLYLLYEYIVIMFCVGSTNFNT